MVAGVVVAVRPYGGTQRVLERTGAPGPERLIGGAGADSLFGLAGVDTLNAKDGEADTVINCGADADTAAVHDIGLDPAPVSCP